MCYCVHFSCYCAVLLFFILVDLIVLRRGEGNDGSGCPCFSGLLCYWSSGGIRQNSEMSYRREFPVVFIIVNTIADNESVGNNKAGIRNVYRMNTCFQACRAACIYLSDAGFIAISPLVICCMVSPVSIISSTSRTCRPSICKVVPDGDAS